MYKIPRSLRLFPGVLLIAAGCMFLFVVSGCGPEQKPPPPPAPPISINPDTLRNHVISIEEARQYTQSFKALLDTGYRFTPAAINSIKLDRAESFPADVFYSLLQQKDSANGAAKGIRIYLGRDPGGQLRLVLVPVDSLGNDIINHLVDNNGKTTPGNAKAHVEMNAASGGQGFEVGNVCPTACPNGTSGL